ncbi:hypothetical protein RPO_04140 [Rickettsia rickettsii str. Arizona]|uniref:Uncharacterized protein n=2 Tax=spotted fever group TaxID=114277 RepID=H8LMI8_RICSL|nr:hypothetical protein RPN_02795 [Rickettsia rickettsii str. Brazil]AFB23685.1 hypothetical protein RPL_04135 [Rickettsia rickettsii str. Colombia]AFB25031.1 hypothetical protein RPO_04140 [Rickettsia rickettsii str. Arizona]AFB26361.1 hypothetical protein RSA_04035 [Rickettsia philipii str. 364D]AFB27714.1 hypothetical protein RPJ_04105 [Rickettsia rickettsii str. Hino]AFB28761.1 hypothetical protein RPK_02455 [Rickettsia rickettsii str. Hlp\
MLNSGINIIITGCNIIGTPLENITNLIEVCIEVLVVSKLAKLYTNKTIILLSNKNVTNQNNIIAGIPK